MKLSIEQHMQRFKLAHGDGEAKINEQGRLEIPTWLLKMIVHLSGIRSRKRRIIKKTITRKINEMLEKATNESK